MYKVLLVDDEPSAKRSIRNIIAAEIPMFEVVGEAEDGQEALRFIDQLGPDVVITDIRMPIMDGLKLAQEIRKANESIEVVIVSGYGSFEYAQQAVKFGVTDYLLKPIMTTDVHATFNRIQSKFVQKRKAKMEQNEQMLHHKTKLEHLTSFLWLLSEEGVRLELQQLHQLLLGECSNLSEMKEMYLQAITFIMAEIAKLNNVSRVQFVDYQCMDSDKCEEALYQTVYELLLHMMDNIRELRNWGAHTTMKVAVQTIKRCYQDPELSLRAIADQVGMSPAYFSKCFKEAVGLGYVDYLMKLRMEKAVELLNNPRIKVYEVAYAVGYREYTRFAKNFRNYYKLSPKDYRHNMMIIESPREAPQ